MKDADEVLEIIEEDPMTPREFELALAGIISRKDRRRIWRVLRDAGLILFRA